MAEKQNNLSVKPVPQELNEETIILLKAAKHVLHAIRFQLIYYDCQDDRRGENLNKK